MGSYTLRCLGCGREVDRFAMNCPCGNALLRTHYADRQLTLLPLPGIWRFLSWLPVGSPLPGTDGGPITYRSEGLASALGLEELWITFSGYWPERDALLPTCSFKELESLPTTQRLLERGREDILVVASAGNTARAFAYTSSLCGQPLVLCVPRSALPKLWLPGREPLNTCTVAVDGDYFDAIRLGEALASRPGFVPEGGARNVARRDGMATVMLDAVMTSGRLPDRYFQAVGSGTGGISAYEASLRLIADGRFGSSLPRLHLVQNSPCSPLITLRTGKPYAPSCPQGMFDAVLFNRSPPYGVTGGVADALEASSGTLSEVSNERASEAARLFLSTEGVDILPAAAVAVAGLTEAIERGEVKAGERVLLNITGGGESLSRRELGTVPIRPDLMVGPEADADELIDRTREVLGI